MVHVVLHIVQPHTPLSTFCCSRTCMANTPHTCHKSLCIKCEWRSSARVGIHRIWHGIQLCTCVVESIHWQYDGRVGWGKRVDHGTHCMGGGRLAAPWAPSNANENTLCVGMGKCEYGYGMLWRTWRACNTPLGCLTCTNRSLCKLLIDIIHTWCCNLYLLLIRCTKRVGTTLSLWYMCTPHRRMMSRVFDDGDRNLSWCVQDHRDPFRCASVCERKPRFMGVFIKALSRSFVQQNIFEQTLS